MKQSSKTKLSPEAVECPHQLILSTKLHEFLTVTGVNQCRHICCMTSELFWINDDYNDIILKKKIVTLYIKLMTGQKKKKVVDFSQ